MGAKIGTRPASVIGPDATLRGDVKFAGDVKVEGEISGNLHCDSLYLTPEGVISGDVIADRVLVCGRVSGSIESREIYLKYGAVVEGDIFHHQLTVEKGAILKGTSLPSGAAVVSPTTDTEGVVRPDLLPPIVTAGREMLASLREKLSSLRLPRPNFRWNPKDLWKPSETEQGDAAPQALGQLSWAGPAWQGTQDVLRRLALVLKSATSSTAISPPGYLEQPEKPKPFRRYRFHVLSPVTNLTIFAALAVFAFARAYDPDPAGNYPLSKTLEVSSERELILFDAKGKEFARRGGCVDAAVSLDEVPQHFIDALLATEDRRFFVHFGIDPVGILRAARTNYEAGKIVQGGSTITQQLAKISYLSSEKSFERKMKEAIAVLRLEASLSKQEILERYLSRAYFGEGCFGLRAASRHYFKQSVSNLTVPQSAMLVALLKSPSQLAQDKDALDAREALVLNAMVDYGKLDAAERAEIKLAKTLNTPRPVFGAFYADWIADTAKVKKNGKLAPLPIKTSFDKRLQRAAD
ncbi:MAG: transglycosylase domain-containing protein, partial [Pseudomonadota bacterium]